MDLKADINTKKMGANREDPHDHVDWYDCDELVDEDDDDYGSTRLQVLKHEICADLRFVECKQSELIEDRGVLMRDNGGRTGTTGNLPDKEKSENFGFASPSQRSTNKHTDLCFSMLAEDGSYTDVPHDESLDDDSLDDHGNYAKKSNASGNHCVRCGKTLMQDRGSVFDRLYKDARHRHQRERVVKAMRSRNQDDTFFLVKNMDSVERGAKPVRCTPGSENLCLYCTIEIKNKKRFEKIRKRAPGSRKIVMEHLNLPNEPADNASTNTTLGSTLSENDIGDLIRNHKLDEQSRSLSAGEIAKLSNNVISDKSSQREALLVNNNSGVSPELFTQHDNQRSDLTFTDTDSVLTDIIPVRLTMEDSLLSDCEEKETSIGGCEKIPSKNVVANIDDLLDGISSKADDNDEPSLSSDVCRFADELADSVVELNEMLREQKNENHGGLVVAQVQKEDDDDTGLLSEKDDSNTLSSEKDISRGALTDAESILTQVEASLRLIGRNEMEDLPEVGLAVAKIFLLALKPLCEGDEPNGKVTNESQRLRLLWPPLAHTVAEAGRVWSRAAREHPFVAATAAMTLWPAAATAVFFGAPLLALDWALQSSYDAVMPRPLLADAERAGHDLVRIGHLSWICAAVLVERTAKDAEQEIERRGGVGRLATDLGGAVVERVTRPVETATIVVDGIRTGVDALKHVGGFVKDVATGGDGVNKVLEQFVRNASPPHENGGT